MPVHLEAHFSRPKLRFRSTQIAVAAYISVGLGDQRVRLGKKTIPLHRIGRFRCTRHELCRLQAQRNTGTPIQWRIVGFQGEPPDLTSR